VLVVTGVEVLVVTVVSTVDERLVVIVTVLLVIVGLVVPSVPVKMDCE